MNEIYEILKGDFKIKKVILYNFTVFDKDFDIEINIASNKDGDIRLFFKDVVKLDIDSRYFAYSMTSSIIIDDVEELQWERVFYKVMVSEDVMTFYCKEISLLEKEDSID